MNLIYQNNSFPMFVNNAVSYVNSIRKCFEFEIFGMNSFVSKFTYFMFSFLKKLTIYFSDSHIFHWILLSSLTWLVIHGIYEKCMKVLLKRVGVNVENRKRWIAAVWQVCFMGVSVPVLVSCVGAFPTDILAVVGAGGWLDRLQYQMAKCKINEEISVPGVKTVFVIHSSFFIQDLVHTWLSKGFKNFEFLQKQVFLANFILTYYSKCPLLGMSLLFLIHRARFIEYLSKLCCLAASFTDSVALRYLSKTFCIYYLLLWSAMFLYILPMFLLANKTIDSDMMKAELKVLIVMDFLMWIYLIAILFNSIVSRIMLSYTSSSDDRPRTLEHFLFGCDPWISNFTAQSKPLNIQSSEGENKRRNPSYEENARALIQTIQCSIVIKRKIKRMREEKERRRLEQPDSKKSV